MIFKYLEADNYYIASNSCVFNELQTIVLATRLKCAFECEAAECKAFQFGEQNSTCHLYSFHEICQSNTMCPNVTTFINNRFNNQVMLLVPH